MQETHLEQAAQTWDTVDIHQVRNVAWCVLERFQLSLRRAFGGDESAERVVHRLLAERIPAERRQALRGAALVCGDMQSERALFEARSDVRFQEVDGYDLSEASLKRFTPDSFKFTPHLVDCNELRLPKRAYDLIVGSHGIHHIYNLGNLFYEANGALNDDGLIYLYEWIGPEYLQIPTSNSLVASFLLYLLFPSRKTRTTHMGRVKGHWVQELATSFDPSEACNAAELMPQLVKYFEPIRMVKHGALAYPMFEGIAQNIDQTRPLNRFKLALVDKVERLLTKLGVIRPLFVMVVAKKRPLPLNDRPDIPKHFRASLLTRIVLKVQGAWRAVTGSSG